MGRGCWARAPSSTLFMVHEENCCGKQSSGMHTHLERVFQNNGNKGKPIIEHIGKHIALGTKQFDLSKISSTKNFNTKKSFFC